MKRAIVIILVLILVAGGSLGGLIMLGIVPNPFVPKVVEKPMSAADKAAMELSRKNKFKAPEAALNLVKMDDMVIPVIMDGRTERRVLLIARIVATGGADETFVEANMNRFQDAVLSDLVPYFQTYFSKSDLVDAGEIKAKMVKHAKAIYGERIKDVLLTNVFEQSGGRIKQ